MESDFTPVLRFIALSDVHYQDEHSVERERMQQALHTAYRIADSHPSYQNLDAVCVVGDFATRGSEIQFQAFKQTLDEGLRSGTKTILALASHEYMGGGPEPAQEKLRRVFGQEPDMHEIINGFHFISLSPSKGTEFDQAKRDWVAMELARAAENDPQKPIFFFQHPHITGTVFGSIIWGEWDLYPILMHYPQVINFSGHSHASVNDPRSIHQEHFTCLGTGTLHYFELDEFDKHCGTIPPDGKQAAQMLIVEADAAGCVRIVPYDLISNSPFSFADGSIEWEIDHPSEPERFRYTNTKRRAAAKAPWFPESAGFRVEGNVLTFNQAVAPQEYVNDYLVRVRNSHGRIIRQAALWSDYYLVPMPETCSVGLGSLAPGEYSIEITARGFWDNKSENQLLGSFTVT